MPDFSELFVTQESGHGCFRGCFGTVARRCNRTNLLGSPANNKKLKTYPGAHSVFGWYDDMVRDTLDWLDEQFGPVTPAGLK
ncbi:MAG: hypothetical protein WA642_12260 [Steroidobacteraceae bacterium]